MSYSSGIDYGYDQISVEPDDMADLLYTTDANKLHTINKIQERENRLLRKIKEFKPTCQENRQRNSKNYCKPSLFFKEGSYIEHNRMNKRKNIEDYYFGGQEFRGNDCDKSDPDRKESFTTTDVRDLHEELEELEKKNNIMVMFIIFLVVVVIIQYAKINNDAMPIQMMMLPPNPSKKPQSNQTSEAPLVEQSSE